MANFSEMNHQYFNLGVKGKGWIRMCGIFESDLFEFTDRRDKATAFHALHCGLDFLLHNEIFKEHFLPHCFSEDIYGAFYDDTPIYLTFNVIPSPKKEESDKWAEQILRSLE